MQQSLFNQSILVVDDDPGSRWMICELLETAGFATHAVENGAEAIEHQRSGAQINLIVLDWNMPVMNGQSFLQYRQKEPALKKIAVVVCSAETLPADLITLFGIDAILEKAGIADTLVPVVRRVLMEHGCVPKAMRR